MIRSARRPAASRAAAAAFSTDSHAPVRTKSSKQSKREGQSDLDMLSAKTHVKRQGGRVPHTADVRQRAGGAGIGQKILDVPHQKLNPRAGESGDYFLPKPAVEDGVLQFAQLVVQVDGSLNLEQPAHHAA